MFEARILIKDFAFRLILHRGHWLPIVADDCPIRLFARSSKQKSFHNFELLKDDVLSQYTFDLFWHDLKLLARAEIK